MKKLLMIIFLFSATVFTADIEFTFENISINEDDSSVTLDLMMKNSIEVGGYQLEFGVGDNIPNDIADDCICGVSNGNGVLPDGCSECYFDSGTDGIKNSYEIGYRGYSSSEDDDDDGIDDFMCEDLENNNADVAGFCSVSSHSTKTACLSAGSCSVECQVDDGTGVSLPCDKDSCVSSGSCSDSSFLDQCDCLWADVNNVWTSEGNYWISDANWTPLTTPEICLSTDENYDFVQWNKDPNNDNFGITSAVNDDSYCSIDGRCSSSAGACQPNGGASGSSMSLPESCCSSTQADAQWVDFIADSTSCVDFSHTWTSFNSKETCNANGAAWVGNPLGTEGSNTFDPGEKYIDTSDGAMLSISGVGDSYAGFSASGNDNTVLGFSFTGAAFPITSDADDPLTEDIDESAPHRVLSMTFSLDGVSSGDIISILGPVCERPGFKCFNQAVISDLSSQPITDVYVHPLVWTYPGSASPAVLGDAVCSSLIGESVENEDEGVCSSYCGDMYCDATISETSAICPVDCESSCNDGVCDWSDGEENSNCSDDCPLFGCGDYVCSDGENNETCPIDCFTRCGFDDDGDGDLCDVGEHFGNCPLDCAEEECGDFYCSALEIDSGSCPGDCPCGIDGDLDGDFCDPGENYGNCSLDCASACGDGFYDHPGLDNPLTEDVNEGGTETGSNCELDYELVCGDTYCGTETHGSCPGDCPSSCGDGFYDHPGLDDPLTADIDESGTETGSNCELDYELVCGDTYCAETETHGSCEVDCVSTCGDGFYDHAGQGGTETGENCALDYYDTAADGYCGQSENWVADPNNCTNSCEDGFCNSDAGETIENCPADCSDDGCGNGVCAYLNVIAGQETILETWETCTSDCDDMCGDGECDTLYHESLANCPSDCSVCGDGECSVGEEYSSCPDDCIPSIGCKEDEAACNYDSTVDVHNVELCVYSELNYDCTGECTAELDCEGVCGGATAVGCNLEQEYADSESCVVAGGIWREIDVEGNCLAIESLTPTIFTLSDNYPNPFNPVTSIEYSVEKAGHVSITIYNLMGHRVFGLVSGYHSPGVRYSASWDSNTQSNIPVSTGIYLYEMRSGDYMERKKMVLVK